MSNAAEVEVYQDPAGSDIEQWARDLSQAYQMSRQLVTTSFVPESYKGKPEEAAAAIITGAEIGLSPLAALRSIDIIQGVPGMRAIALRALVQSKGHQMWIEESTATRCVMKGRRKDSDKVETVTWDMTRAQGLSLHTKANWKNQPIAMLIARATSEMARLIAADVLLGIPYSIEELEDQADVAATATGAQPAAKRTSTRAKRAPLDPQRGEAPDLPTPELEAPKEPEAETPADPATGEVDDDVKRAEEARAAAAKEFSERPPMDEPMVDWEPPTDADAPAEEPS